MREGWRRGLRSEGKVWPGFKAQHRATDQRQAPPVWRAAAGPGRASRRRTKTHTSTQVVAGVEGAGGTCRGAGGRRRGLAGLRADAPSEAHSANGSRAGRHPPAHTATRHHWCGGRRRDRRARAGFEIDHSEPSGSRVAISRAAGPDGARNTSGATQQQHGAWTASGRAGRAAAGDLSGEQATTAGFTRPRGGRPRA